MFAKKISEATSLGEAVIISVTTSFAEGKHHSKKKSTSKEVLFFLEVPPGFEPGNNGFADRGLTTWLWYHMERMTRLELATSTLARWRSTR